jgi:hypothetical protein
LAHNLHPNVITDGDAITVHFPYQLNFGQALQWPYRLFNALISSRKFVIWHGLGRPFIIGVTLDGNTVKYVLE